MIDIATLTAEQAQELVGEVFRLHLESRTLEFKVTNIVVLTEKHVDARLTRDAFAMHFLGPRDVQMVQATVPLQNDQHGVMEIFMVPIGVTPEGYLYEAIFS
jgi:hypothetical protein